MNHDVARVLFVVSCCVTTLAKTCHKGDCANGFGWSNTYLIRVRRIPYLLACFALVVYFPEIDVHSRARTDTTRKGEVTFDDEDHFKGLFANEKFEGLGIYFWNGSCTLSLLLLLLSLSTCLSLSLSLVVLLLPSLPPSLPLSSKCMNTGEVTASD